METESNKRFVMNNIAIHDTNDYEHIQSEYENYITFNYIGNL